MTNALLSATARNLNPPASAPTATMTSPNSTRTGPTPKVCGTPLGSGTCSSENSKPASAGPLTLGPAPSRKMMLNALAEEMVPFHFHWSTTVATAPDPPMDTISPGPPCALGTSASVALIDPWMWSVESGSAEAKENDNMRPEI